MDYTYTKGEAIRYIRCGRSITQESVCDRICSTKSLSMAENGRSDISDGLFEMLMNQMGYKMKSMPDFSSKAEYDLNELLNKVLYMILAFKITRAKGILDEMWEKYIPMSSRILQKYIAIDSMIYEFTGNYDEKLVENLTYALSLSGKSGTVDSPCTIREFEVYLLLAVALYNTGKIEDAAAILRGLKQYCGYILRETDYTYNHLYVYYESALFIMNEESDGISVGYIDRVLSYAKSNDDGLAVLLLTYGKAKQYLLSDDIMRFHSEISAVIDMAEYMECPFRHVLYKWIVENGHVGNIDVTVSESHVAEGKPDIIVRKLTDIQPDRTINNNYTIWDVIREKRVQNGISATKLSEGICSQSKLSKMETGKQGCDILIIHSLLQRLEIEDEQFIFFVSKSERDAYIEMRRINYYLNQTKVIVKRDELFGESKENPVRKQLGLIYESYCTEDPDRRKAILRNALSCTKPNFDINSIDDELFTDAEWKCLVDLTVLYGVTKDLGDFMTCYTSIEHYMKTRHALSRFKRRYAMNELKRAFAYNRDYRMVRLIENEIEDFSKTSYRRYRKSVDNLITNME